MEVATITNQEALEEKALERVRQRVKDIKYGEVKMVRIDDKTIDLVFTERERIKAE